MSSGLERPQAPETARRAVLVRRHPAVDRSRTARRRELDRVVATAADAYSHADSHAYSHADGHTDGHSDTDPDGITDGDRDRDGVADRDEHWYGDTVRRGPAGSAT